MSKKVALYCRVSTDSQTTENQVLELKVYCERQGWSIYKVYEDKGVSGSQHDRPALDEMLQDAEKKKFDILVVWKIDRIARSVVHLLEVLTTLRNLGIGFASETESINTESAQGRMLLTFLAGISEFEREICIERVRSGMARCKAQGIKKIGRPRVGFDVKKAIELRQDGLGYKQIAKQMNIARTTLYRSLRAIPKTQTA